MIKATKPNISRIEPADHAGSKGLSLSVIVPVYNTADQLKQCLSALAASRGIEFEVLVVDDGSTQLLEPIVRGFGFRYLRLEGPGGPARARNHGVAQTNGTCLAFIDADVCVHPDTLLRMTEAFNSNPAVDAVVGTYDDEPADPSFISQYKNLFHHFVHCSNVGPIPTFWSGCGAIRRDAFVKFGGFDEHRYHRPAIEDIELGTRMTTAGHQIVLDERIRCKHLKRWTLRSLLKTDIFDRGIPWTRLMLEARHIPANLNTRPTQMLSVVLMYLTVLAMPLAFLGRWGWAAPLLGIVGVTVLNWDFYRFFISRRGAWFALRAAPLHWLYFLYCGFCFAVGAALHMFTKNKAASLMVLVLTGLTLFLYGRGLSTGPGFAGDALHHLMNGVFLHDAVHNFTRFVAHPLQYGFEYYRHYPAVNLGYYPPTFAAIEAAVMFVFGVSPVSAHLAILLMALLLTYFSFAWFRLHFDAFWSAGATAVLMSTPMLVYWGRDIMLEIPVLAWMMGAMWAFERVLRSPHPTWRESLTWALLTTLAIWTKQHAIMLLGIFAITALTSGGWRLLKYKSLFAATAIVAIAATALIAISFYLGGDAVKHSVGTQSPMTSRFTAEQWTFYISRLPDDIVGWPMLMLAGFGLIMFIIRRHPYIWPILSWLVLFYVMHSYFLAQETRYACLWIPPFCWLATFSLRQTPSPNRFFSMGGALMTIFVAVSVVRGALLPVQVLPPAYQQAADDLAETMPPFSCLSFLPDRPGRIAVCYRLAIEQKQSGEKNLFSFGHILRADQVLRDWKRHWPDAKALAQTLREWNVAFLVVESPLPINRTDAVANEAIEGLLKLGALREYRRYPISYQVKQRTLILYQWATPITYSTGTRPTIQTWRIPTTIHPSNTAH